MSVSWACFTLILITLAGDPICHNSAGVVKGVAYLAHPNAAVVETHVITAWLGTPWLKWADPGPWENPTKEQH